MKNKPKTSESAGRSIRLRARVWAEERGAQLITDASADLLEQIAATGSLSEAARRLGYSYRRAWMMLDAMNARWLMPLVETLQRVGITPVRPE